jgi:hypothetical protein
MTLASSSPRRIICTSFSPTSSEGPIGKNPTTCTRAILHAWAAASFPVIKASLASAVFVFMSMLVPLQAGCLRYGATVIPA